jgi:predicted MPP superfamily phosphohydrolase
VLLEEKIRLGLFVGAVLAVYAAALVVGVHAAGRALQRRRGLTPQPLGRTTRRVRAAVLTLALAGTGCAAYARLIEPTWLDVTHVSVESDKLPRGIRPIRLVHISDVHSDPVARLEDRLPGAIAAERPDLIVFTGDSINSPEGLANFRGLMTRLAAVAPTYAVRGNWDTRQWGRIDLFGGTGAVELENQAVRVALDGGRALWLVGLDADSGDQIESALGRVPAGALTVLLHHYPEEIDRVAAAGADLFCAGHTHGGQVALPFYGALITMSRTGKRYEAGLYREGRTWLYVNRGIGMEGGVAPRIRFFARPEVTVIELRPPG